MQVRKLRERRRQRALARSVPSGKLAGARRVKSHGPEDDSSADSGPNGPTGSDSAHGVRGHSSESSSDAVAQHLLNIGACVFAA